MAEVVGRPRIVAAFDAALASVAAVLLCAEIVLAVRLLDGSPQLGPVLIGSAVCAPILARFAVSVEGKQSVSVTFESAALVLMLFLADRHVALALWSIGVVIGLLLSRARWRARVFNAALTVLCGLGLTATVELINPGRATDVSALIAILVGCLVSTVIDSGLSYLHVMLRTGAGLRTLATSDTLITTFVSMGLAAVGFLGALVAQLQVNWVMWVLLVPVGAVILASQSTRRSIDDQRRLSVLLEGSRERRHQTNQEDILQAAVGYAIELLGSETAHLRETGPAGNEIGSSIDLGDGREVWLISPPRRDRTHWLASERQALDTLVGDTAEALARARLITELSRLAKVDGLSGLLNRTTFAATVRRHLVEAAETGRYPTLVYLDLDDFKRVNDLHGHHMGDALVREVAGRMRASVPTEGVCARLGGDEFAILLPPDCLVTRVVETVLAALEQRFTIDGIALTLSASIGVAHGQPGMDADRLFRNADLAMYCAKADRNSSPVVYHEQMGVQDDLRNQLREDLTRAIEREELKVVYQPVWDLHRHGIDGVETLVRWQHPTRGLLTAEAFIDIAEESGLISRVGEWVLRQAMVDAHRMARVAGRPLSVGVNVSPRQLWDDTLLESIREVMAADTSGTNLVLELTEGALTGTDPAIRHRLDRLVQAGAAIALDDFGVGHSSVSYLRWLPMQIIKLDPSLLDHLEDGRASDLVSALIAMGDAMDLIVVAEGIERADQLETLRDFGCQLGQGHWLSAPLPLEELLELIAQANSRRVAV